MVVFGDPGLTPEHSITYEAGVRADADSWGSLRVSAYRTLAENFIDLQPGQLLYGRMTFLYANLERVQIDGLELAGRARVLGATTTLSATMPRGRDLRSGLYITSVGTSHVSADVSIPVRWIPSGMLALRARWSDAIKTDPFKKAQYDSLNAHAFWTGNVELGTTVVATRLTLSMRNVFNNRYREALSFVDEPRRTFAFAIKRDFPLPVRFGLKETH